MQINQGNETWHTDSTYIPVSSKVAMLAAHTVPSEGGETGFAGSAKTALMNWF